MMRGLVLERRGRHAIVLLPGGEIRQVHAARASAGDEILLAAPAHRAPARRYGYAAAALALVLAVLPAELPLAQAKVVAYATVDINPSVQLGLSAGGTVLTSRALDADGRRVLATAAVRGEPLSAAVASLLRAAKAQGFISAARLTAVIVAGYGSGAQALPPAVQVQLRSARNLASAFLLKHGLHGVVSAMIVPRVLVQAAGRVHVSAGVYAVWSALHKAGLKVRVGDMRGSDLGAAMAKIAATASGRSVLPLLTGKPSPHGTGLAPSTPSGGVKSGATVGPSTQTPGEGGQGAQSSGASHGTQPSGTSGGQGTQPSGATGGEGTQPSGADQQHASGTGLQVQILTPGGTLQLQLGGEDQEGSGAQAVPQGGTPSGRGDGQGDGGHGRQGRGHDGRGASGAGQGVVPGGTFPLAPSGGDGTGNQGGHGKDGHGLRSRGDGGGQGIMPSGTFPLAPAGGDGTQGAGQDQQPGGGQDQQPGGGQGGDGGGD